MVQPIRLFINSFGLQNNNAMFKKKSLRYYLIFMIICSAGIFLSIINAYEAKIAGNNFKLFGRTLLAVIFCGWAISNYQSYRSLKRKQQEMARH